MKEKFGPLLILVLIIVTGCSHVPKPKNPFHREKKKKSNEVVIGGVRYIKIPVRDKSGKITGYRYVRKEGGTFAPKTAPSQGRYVGAKPLQPSGPSVPYYKRYGLVGKTPPTPASSQAYRKGTQAKTAPSPKPPGKIRKKVVILTFSDKTDYKQEGWGKIVPQKIGELLESSGKVRLVDEGEVKSVLGIKGPIRLDRKTLVELGKLFSVQAVISGEVSGIYISKRRERSFEVLPISIALARIEVRIYDTLSGTLLKSLTETNSFFMTEESGKFSEEKARLKAIDLVSKKASKDILEEIAVIPWWSRVTNVEGDKVYINSGKLSGIPIGKILTVREKGKEVVDQATKKLMGVAFGKEKAKIKVVNYLGIDGSICNVISGNDVNVNDIVTLK